MSNVVTIRVELDVTRRGAGITAEQVEELLKDAESDLTYKSSQVPITEANNVVNEPARALVVLRKIRQALLKALKDAEKEEENAKDERPSIAVERGYDDA